MRQLQHEEAGLELWDDEAQGMFVAFAGEGDYGGGTAVALALELEGIYSIETLRYENLNENQWVTLRKWSQECELLLL